MMRYSSSLLLTLGLSLAVVAEPFRSPDVVGNWHSPGPLAFSPDSSRLASLNSKGIAVWDLTQRKVFRTLAHPGGGSLTFSPSGRQLLVGGWEDRLQLFDIESGKALWSSTSGRKEEGKGHLQTALVGGGQTVLTVGVDYGRAIPDPMVRFWDLLAGKPFRSLEGGRRCRVLVSLDRRWVAMGDTRTRRTQLLEAETGTRRTDLEGVAMGFSSEGLVARQDKQLKLFAFPDFKASSWSLPAPSGDPLVLRERLVCSETGEEGVTISVVRLKDGSTVSRIRPKLRARGAAWVQAISADERWLATNSMSGELQVWEMATGKLLASVDNCRGALAFAPDGRSLAYALESGVALVELPSGKLSKLP